MFPSKATEIQVDIEFLPIIDVKTMSIAFVEGLCRPKDLSIQQYFNVPAHELWEREKKPIEIGIMKEIPYLKSFNITLDSLPYLIESDLIWNGSIEIVEWSSFTSEMQLNIMTFYLKNRNMKIFADDIEPHTLLYWSSIPFIDGYKLDRKHLLQRSNFIKDVVEVANEKGRTVTLEGIETKDEEIWAIEQGVHYVQGFLYKNMMP